MKPSTTKLFFLIPFISCFIYQSPVLALDTISPPNIVLILADDVALMDFGVYGGEASTPNIDLLAKKGTIFTNHHASPMCAPSRAMLLTGYDSHLTGVPNLPLFLPPEYTKKPGYEGIINDKIKTVATRLKDRGYRTYMAGKWHLGHTANTLPSKRGFDRTFILDASGADNWEHKAYLPSQSKPPWFEDGQSIELPDDFYSSRHLVNKMISFMDDEKDKKPPFFSFLSFQAVHLPVQAPKEFVAKYKGVYDGGWNELRAKRFAKAKELGLIPDTAQLAGFLPVLNKWDDLSAAEKHRKAQDMSVNAAMLEAMDFHIGRYIEYLKENDLFENTVFIITSDNGPEASDPSLLPGMTTWMKYAGYHRDTTRLGEKGYFGYIGPEFGSAAASPSSFFKFYAGEGGLRTPLIISGASEPNTKKAFTFITDITPTILNIASIGDYTQNKNELPLTGRNLIPLMNNQTDHVYQADEPIGMEAAGQAALFFGDMKLVRNGKPYGDGVWRLYNMKTDPGETNDLSEIQPAVFQSLMEHYEVYKKKFGVLDMPEGYEAIKEIEKKFIRNVKKKAIPWLIGLSVLIIGLWIRRRNKKKRKTS